MASTMEASAPTVITSAVMIWSARMGDSQVQPVAASSVHRPASSRFAPEDGQLQRVACPRDRSVLAVDQYSTTREDSPCWTHAVDQGANRKRRVWPGYNWAESSTRVRALMPAAICM